MDRKQMTAPLVPPECDLRDFGFMPLDVRRFRDSDLVSFERPEAVLAAILLWGASWHNVPASSLTDDDRALAQLAGYGRAVGEFKKIKDGALRGFVKCSDGLLYHPVVAAKAIEAWERKLRQRWNTECARVRKHNERNPDDRLEQPTFEAWKAGATRIAEKQHSPPIVTSDSRSSHADTALSHADKPRDIGSKGQGQGQGQGQGHIDSTTGEKPNGDRSPSEEPPPDLMAITASLANAAGVSILRPTHIAKQMDIVKDWVAKGISVDDTILPTIADKLKDLKDDETVGSLSFFDALIRKRHSLARRKGERAKPTGPKATIRSPEAPDDRVVQLRAALKTTIGDRVYSSWFDPEQTAFTLNGASVTLTTATAFGRDRIIEHFRQPLKAVVSSVLNMDDVRVEAQ